MSSNREPAKSGTARSSVEDWWYRYFGNRGLVQLIFGRDVEPILVVILTGTLCCLILFEGKEGLLGSFMNMMFFIVGNYFRRGGSPTDDHE